MVWEVDEEKRVDDILGVPDEIIFLLLRIFFGLSPEIRFGVSHRFRSAATMEK